MSIIDNGPGVSQAYVRPPDDGGPVVLRTSFPAPERLGVWRTALGVFLGLIAFTVLVLVVMVALNLMFAGSITGGSGLSSGEPYFTP